MKLNAGGKKQASAAAERSLPGSCWGQKSSIKSRSQREWLWSGSQELSFRAGDMAEIFSDREDLYFFDCQGKRIRKDMARLLELAEGRAV